MSIRSQRAIRSLRKCIALLVLLSVALPLMAQQSTAAPVAMNLQADAAFQLQDWLTPETASRLDIGIDVLVPSSLPAPFSGEPEVQASDGYYSLYWLIPGAPPTYLRITGSWGGEIPAFSYYDRNVQLEQNDTVQGYPAWHDVTPIYDLVYWQVGDVLYTVESHNMTGDSTMGVANGLVSLVAPETGGETGTDETTSNGTPVAAPKDGIVVSAIGAPSTVASSEIASIAVQGTGEVYLVASDGYFLSTGDTGTVITGGSTVDWQAPYADNDLSVTFGAYRLSDDKKLAESSTTVHGVAAAGVKDVPIDIQCPANASASMQARIALSGSGGVTITSSSGYWPIETPNTDFQPTMDGSQAIGGGLGSGSAISLVWVAPDQPGSSTLSVTDATGVEVDSCTIEVVRERGSGDLGAPSTGADGQYSGDGTGISEGESDVVAQVIANPIGFAGDASGGPEANAGDYGYVDETATEKEDETTSAPSRTPVSSSARGFTEASDTKLGPAAGADGMYAITLGDAGGTLVSPFGATVRVPKGALEDQTTVMIKPVDAQVIPETPGIETIAGTAFDVAFGAADGRAVENLANPATLTIALQSASMSENARIYKIEGSTLTLMPLTDSDAGSISTQIDGLARYVVGVPQADVAASSSSINPFLIGGLGLIALISAGLLVSRGLSRRKPRFIPARRSGNNRVRYR